MFSGGYPYRDLLKHAPLFTWPKKPALVGISLHLLGFGFRFDFSELGVDPAARNGHDNGLCRPDFFFTDPFLLGDPKIMFHSGRTPEGHSGGHMDQKGRLWVKNVISPG